MAGKYGYDEIRKIAFFGLAFGEAFEKQAQATSTIAKVSAFLSCVDEGIELLSINREELKNEWDDFGPDDRDELATECATEFNLDDKNLEQRIESSIKAGLQILAGIEAAIAAWKTEDANS